ncbi:MAG: hypothetical protein L6V87_05285 [Ruminococcus sp.]|nr:MAG: hypothetical protein L6V87_05285 [Ruminococcus sp.]
MDKADAGLSDELIEVLRQYYYMKNSLGAGKTSCRGEMKVLSYIHYTAGGGEIATGDIVSALDMTGGRVAGILRSLEKKRLLSAAAPMRTTAAG